MECGLSIRNIVNHNPNTKFCTVGDQEMWSWRWTTIAIVDLCLIPFEAIAICTLPITGWLFQLQLYSSPFRRDASSLPPQSGKWCPQGRHKLMHWRAFEVSCAFACVGSVSCFRMLQSTYKPFVAVFELRLSVVVSFYKTIEEGAATLFHSLPPGQHYSAPHR